jgi:hypothetical protein
MDIAEPNKIKGIIPQTPGIIYRQFDRLNEINDRIQGRQFPDTALQPNYDPRPVPTKYSLFPIIERRKMENQVPLMKYLDYSTENSFAPIYNKGTVNGFFSNIHTESVLRNQYFALQKGADQSIYVPSSSSDLYNFTAVGRQENQTHTSLFQTPSFDNTPNANLNPAIGSDHFFNHTRTQLRGL